MGNLKRGLSVITRVLKSERRWQKRVKGEHDHRRGGLHCSFGDGVKSYKPRSAGGHEELARPGNGFCPGASGRKCRPVNLSVPPQ